MENEEVEQEPTEGVSEEIQNQNNGEDGVQNGGNDEERDGNDVGGPIGNDVTEHEGGSVREADAIDDIVGGERSSVHLEEARSIHFNDETTAEEAARLDEDVTHVEMDPNAEAARQSSEEILQSRQSFVPLDLIEEAGRERGSLATEDNRSVGRESQDHQTIHSDEEHEDNDFFGTPPSPTPEPELENLMPDQQSPEPSSSKPLPAREAEYRVPAQSPLLTVPVNRMSLPFENNLYNWHTQAPNDNMVLPPLDPRHKPVVMPHEYPYHAASQYLRNPFYTPEVVCPKMCCEPSQWLSTTRFAGPDRKTTRPERHWARYKSLEDRSVPEALARPNPAATVPMRARKWKGMTWMDPPEDKKHCDTYADKDKAKKDRLKAQKIGYETLVGNLIYYDIPGAKDLNRSWKHFLDPDPMAWGFPYAKGTRERPHLPPPVPYLVHQMKEQLWKWPRNKLISHSTPTPSVPESGNDGGKGSGSANVVSLN